MSEEKNIINYTAADIEKYWKGKLSASEMHAIEKAAMDDPFLADALEGYKKTNWADSDLSSLKERLDKRVGAFIPVINLKRKRFTWVRVAAAVIIIVGVGLLVQQLVFNDQKNNSIAVLEQNDKKSESVANNNPVKTDDSINKDVSTQSGSAAINSKQKATDYSNAGNSSFFSTPDTNKKTSRSDVEYKKGVVESVPSTSARTFANAEKKDEPAKEIADPGRTVNDSTKMLADKKVDAAISAAKPNAKQAYADVNDRFLNVITLNNKYNYRVVDAQNNPVPFANVMNTRDNVGTYTDIRGNFNLVSSDSILHVQIKSLGYNVANYKLVPSNVQSGFDMPKGDLVLKESERRETFAQQNKKVVSSVSRKDSAEIEEPEVGWGNYNTYVANNIQIPENVRPKNTRSDVELSFDIDKTGQPINIKVTRSSQCKECDEEAIRLLKEGPKWKRKGKRSKATVSIAVDQK